MLFFIIASFVIQVHLESVQNIQEKSFKFFEIEYQTYKVLQSHFDTIVLWIYHNDSIELELEKVIENVYKKKLNETEIIFCKGKFDHFFSENPDIFNQDGFYLHHEDQIVFLELNNIQSEEFLQQLIDTIQPTLEIFTDISQVEEYMSDFEKVKGLLILDETNEQFHAIKKIFYKIYRTGALKISGLNHFCWYKSNSFKDYQQPTLLIKNQQRYPIQYQGNLTDQNEIVDFIKTFTLPLLSELVPANLDRIFNGYIKTQIHLLINEDENENEDLMIKYRRAAFKNYGSENLQDRIIFTYCPYSCNPQIWNDFKFTQDTKTPQILLTYVDLKKYYVDKYTFPFEEINEFSIEDFLTLYREKKLKKFYLSEDIPEPDQYIEIWKKIVSKNFEKEVYDNDQNVLVLFWTQQNPKTLELYLTAFRDVWRNFSDDQKSLIKLVILDISINEHELIQIERIPSLVLYRKNYKDSPHYHISVQSSGNFKEWLYVLNLNNDICLENITRIEIEGKI